VGGNVPSAEEVFGVVQSLVEREELVHG